LQSKFVVVVETLNNVINHAHTIRMPKVWIKKNANIGAIRNELY